MSQQVYRTPQIEFNWQAAVTNTTPTAAYRGAGRPEATHLVERMLDIAADELDIDPVEIRRKNFIPPDAFPYTTVTGAHLRHRRVREAARRAARTRRTTRACAPSRPRVANATIRSCSASDVSSYVEITAPVGLHREYGQGRDRRRRHRPRLRRHQLARPGSRDRVLDDRRATCSACRWNRSRSCSPTPRSIPQGGGTGGSRSLQIAGSAVKVASEEVLDPGEAARRAHARGESRRHRHRRRRAPGRRRPGARALVGRPRGGGEGRRPPARKSRSATRARARLRRRARRRSPSARTSRSWRSTARPAGSSCCATSRSTTAARS